MKGDDFIANSKKAREDIAALKEAAAKLALETATVEVPEKIVAEWSETSSNLATKDLSCRLCMDRQISTVYLPCGHLIACSYCASSVVSQVRSSQ